MVSEGKRLSMDTLYQYIPWPTSPDDERARARFKLLVGEFARLTSLEQLKPRKEGGKLRVLDVMAASGIAGAALAAALAGRGYRVELLAVDVRAGEVGLARRWVELSGYSGAVSVEGLAADATRLPEEVGEGGWDYVVVWGSSLGHLDSLQLNQLLAGVRELQDPDGVLLLEQDDTGSRLLLTRSFEPVYVEGSLLLLYAGYDPITGSIRRHTYRLPEMRYLGDDYTRMWSVADIVGRLALLYEKVYVGGVSDIPKRMWLIAARNPRSRLPSWRELSGFKVERLPRG